MCLLNLQVKDRICRLVHSGVENGARMLLDGRHVVVCISFYSVPRQFNCFCTKPCLTPPPSFSSNLGLLCFESSCINLLYSILKKCGILVSICYSSQFQSFARTLECVLSNLLMVNVLWVSAFQLSLHDHD